MDFLSRKTSKVRIVETVPQTDSGGWGEEPQVIGRILPKELGKKAVVTSEYDLHVQFSRKRKMLRGAAKVIQATVYQKHRVLLKPRADV